MSSDLVWIALVVINVLGFFIRTERPVLVYNLEKWATVRVGVVSRAIFSTNVIGLAITVILIAAFMFSDRIPFGMLLLCIILIFTSLSLYKLINALVPPQRKVQAVAKVLDTLFLCENGEGTSQEYVVMKVLLPELGVRVLPPCPNAVGLVLNIGGEISVFFRRGCFSRIYRFSFDRCF